MSTLRYHGAPWIDELRTKTGTMTDQTLNYIAGDWTSGSGEIENRNPSDLSDVVGRFAQADAAQLDRALEAARAAQAQWGQSGLERRYKALMAIGERLMARSGELGELLSREEGKPRAEGAGEVYRSGQFFTYFAAETLRQIGDTADSVRDGIEIDVRREPVGVVAVISPWNFPMATASWKIAPALAFGNAVIWKPANLTPASAVALTEIIAEQDLPDGLFNLVMGPGRAVGQRLVESPLVNAISFTGSLDVGRGIAASAVGNLTRVQLEMGSKNALAVMEDGDLDTAVACALNGAFGGTGQKCTASSRLVVHEKVHDTFVEKLVAGARALKVDHALAEGTQLGPVASEYISRVSTILTLIFWSTGNNGANRLSIRSFAPGTPTRSGICRNWSPASGLSSTSPVEPSTPISTSSKGNSTAARSTAFAMLSVPSVSASR